MGFKPVTTPPPDKLLEVRAPGQSALSNADAIAWLDLGAGYTLGDLDRTANTPVKRVVFVVDFETTTSPSSSDTITVNLYRDASGDKTGADVEVLAQFDDADAPVSGRIAFEVDNRALDGTLYQHMGFEVSADTVASSATFSAYVYPEGNYGIG